MVAIITQEIANQGMVVEILDKEVIDLDKEVIDLDKEVIDLDKEAVALDKEAVALDKEVIDIMGHHQRFPLLLL